MFLDAALMSTTLTWWCLALAALVLLPTARFAQWQAMVSIPLRQHLLLASLVFLVVLWLISVRVFDGLWLHFMGITTVTLLVGWRFTVLLGAVASCGYALLIDQPIIAAAPAWLVTVLIPASLSRLLVYWLRRRPQSNLFIYLLGAGFGGGALSALGLAAGGLLLLELSGDHSRVMAALENWPLMTLIMFPEGFINGMVLSVIVVLNPEAVKTFDSDKYMGEG